VILGPVVLLPLIFLVAAALPLLVARTPAWARRLGYGGSVVGAAAVLLVSVGQLTGAAAVESWQYSPAPSLVFGLRLDGLSAAFLLALALTTFAVGIAAIGSAARYDERGGPRLAAAYNLFIVAMLLVLLADGVFTFLLCWEVMSLAGYLLVTHEHERREARRAGFIYLALSHLGTAFLIGGLFWLVSVAGSTTSEFQSIAGHVGGLAPVTRDAIFVLIAIGFSAKAGVMPFHIWLPRAYRVAPSHASALSSGVMIKTAIYGLARVMFTVFDGGPAWWGWALIAAGALSAVFGALYAFTDEDLNRLLAFSSVENVGIILIGLGSAAVLHANQSPLAALAGAAALVHVIGHALFKSLLFISVGAIDSRAGTTDLEQLGGLIHRMPRLAIPFLIGSMALAGLPPLSGFASEWMTFQSLLAIGSRVGGLAAVAAIGAIGSLALAAGLAAATAMKAFGISMLGRARSPAAGQASEASGAVLIGLGLLSFATVAIGFWPGALVELLGDATRSFAGVVPAVEVTPLRGLLGVGSPHAAPARIEPVALVLLAAMLAVAIWAALRALGPVPWRRGPVWVSGFALDTRMQYTGSAFAETGRLFFRSILRPTRHVVPEWAAEPWFPARLYARGGGIKLAEHHFYAPMTHALLRIANALRVIQNGSLRNYLLYIFATLVLLLVLATR
jgi:hydrogenase-4 component B